MGDALDICSDAPNVHLGGGDNEPLGDACDNCSTSANDPADDGLGGDRDFCRFTASENGERDIDSDSEGL